MNLLRSVFLGTMNEINWAFIDGPKTFAPNLYERFSGLFERENLIESYYEKVVTQNSSFIHGFGMITRRILSQINPEKYYFEMRKK